MSMGKIAEGIHVILKSEPVSEIKNRMVDFFKTGTLSPSAYASIATHSPITYIISFFVQLIIIWYLLFKMNIGNLQKNYPEMTLILLSFFMIFKACLFVMMRYMNTRLTLDKKPDPPPVGRLLLLETFSITFGSIIILALISIFMLLLRYFTNDNIIGFVGYLLILLFILSVIAVISFFVYQYKKQDKRDGTLYLFELLLRYIPCLIFDILNWVKNEMSTVSKLGIIIIGIIVVYIGSKYINTKLTKIVDDKYLLNGPVYINKERAIAVNSNYDPDNEPNPQYNYSTSFWFWITPQPPSINKNHSQYTNIFTYGDRPSIDYNQSLDMLRISCRLSSDSIEELYTTTKIPKQTWNQFVMNYNGGTMDVFLNGELVSSNPNITPYIKSEDIIIGKDDGIHGGIRDVVHSYELFTTHGIKMIYYIKKMMFQFE